MKMIRAMLLLLLVPVLGSFIVQTMMGLVIALPIILVLAFIVAMIGGIVLFLSVGIASWKKR